MKWITAIILTLLSHQALACTICFGDPNSKMSQGILAGVWFLLGVVGLVLISFLAFIFYLKKKEK